MNTGYFHLKTLQKLLRLTWRH